MAGGKRRRKDRAPRIIIKRESFLSFTSVTLQLPIMSATVEIASVSSEFDIFTHRTIHGTMEVAYKPIAPSIKMIWNFNTCR